MNIFDLMLKPDYNIDSVYDIDILEFQKLGIKALLFDLDSTLMKSKSGKFSYKTLQFLEDLSTNFKLAIVTNNNNREYINKAKSQTDIPIYYNCAKPKIDVITKVCRDLGVKFNQTVIIGDRPLSDILAGKNAGMTTVLVDSISKDSENKLVRFVRFLERLTIIK